MRGFIRLLKWVFRLFLLLISATAVVWLSAVAWIYFANRADLEHVLDTRLQEAARIIGQ